MTASLLEFVVSLTAMTFDLSNDLTVLYYTGITLGIICS